MKFQKLFLVLILLGHFLFYYIDIFTDILVILRNYRLERWEYLTALGLSILWERIFNFFYNTRFFILIFAHKEIIPGSFT